LSRELSSVSKDNAGVRSFISLTQINFMKHFYEAYESLVDHSHYYKYKVNNNKLKVTHK